MAPLEVGPVSSSRAERTFRSQAARRPPLSTVISYSSVVRARIGCPCCVRRASNGRLVRTAPILGRRRHSSAVEQLFRKQQVLGSNPSVGSISPFRAQKALLSDAEHGLCSCRPVAGLLTGEDRPTISISPVGWIPTKVARMGMVGRRPGSRYTPATFKRSSRGSRLAWIPIVMPRTAVPTPTRTSPCGGRSSTARTRSTRERGAA